MSTTAIMDEQVKAVSAISERLDWLPGVSTRCMWTRSKRVVGEFPTKKSESEKWDWKLVAAWVDTEGCFSTSPDTLRATITQKERGPLEGIRSFFEKEGIRSKIISLHKENREYFYLITKGGMEALATLVVNIKPYIGT